MQKYFYLMFYFFLDIQVNYLYDLEIYSAGKEFKLTSTLALSNHFVFTNDRSIQHSTIDDLMLREPALSSSVRFCSLYVRSVYTYTCTYPTQPEGVVHTDMRRRFRKFTGQKCC